MAACVADATLYFHHVVSSSFFLPRLISVVAEWMCTHGVALVLIYNAGLKCAARGSLEIQDAKVTQKSPFADHRTTLSGCIFATKACIDNRKKDR